MQSRGPGPQFGLREVIGQREKPRWPPVRLKVTSVSRQKRRRARQQALRDLRVAVGLMVQK